MNRPFITLDLGDIPRSPRTCVDSLEYYRTLSFGIEQMQKMIVAGPFPGNIDASLWYAFVPDCYKPAVLGVVERATEGHRGKWLTRGTLHAFIDDLNCEIWSSIEPVIPC